MSPGEDTECRSDHERRASDYWHSVTDGSRQIEVGDRRAIGSELLGERRERADQVVADVREGLAERDACREFRRGPGRLRKPIPVKDGDACGDTKNAAVWTIRMARRAAAWRRRGIRDAKGRESRSLQSGRRFDNGTSSISWPSAHPPEVDGCEGQTQRPAGPSRSVGGRKKEPRYGVIATFRTPSRRSPKSRYASPMSASGKRCVSSGVGSNRPACDHLDQAAHPLLAAGAERGDDAVVAEPGGERLVRHLELAGVDAEARQRAARAERAQGALERLLRAERLDGHVDAGPLVRRMTSSTTSTFGKSRTTSAPIRRAIASRTASPSTPMTSAAPISFAPAVGAQADRALREDDDRVADADAARLGAGEAGRGDVGEQHDLLVGHVVRDLREVGLRVRHEQVLGLRAVDRVAEPPAADGLVAGRRGRTARGGRRGRRGTGRRA